MPSSTGTTLQAELLDASAQLLRAGVPDHRRVALQIWADLSQSSPADAWLRRNERMTPEDEERFRKAVDRRCAGEPVPYTTGTAAFRHLMLTVDARVLIPRPETEGLVDIVLAWARNQADPSRLRVLEVGVGSGCIILSLAVEGMFAELVGTDTSLDALAVAEENRARVCPDENVELRQGSFFDPVAGETFDIVVSNPPYVTEQEYERLEPGVREFEPRQALVSEEAGLYHTRKICEGAQHALNPEGLLALEIDAERDLEALSIAVAAGFEASEIRRDLFGRPRYLVAQRQKA